MEIVLVDAAATADPLDVEERRSPRLSASDIARYSSMPSTDDRARIWRAGRIATRVVLERWVGPELRGVDFIVETGGRLRVPEPPPYFSVSHSGDLLLVAVSERGVVGVDLERKRPLTMQPERRERLLRASAAIGGTQSSESPAMDMSDCAVLESWVRLEAVAKARGSGIGVLLTEAGVMGDAVARLVPRSMPFEAKLLEAGEGIVAAVAGVGLQRAVAVTRFPADAAAIAAFLGAAPGPQGR